MRSAPYFTTYVNCLDLPGQLYCSVYGGDKQISPATERRASGLCHNRSYPHFDRLFVATTVRLPARPAPDRLSVRSSHHAAPERLATIAATGARLLRTARV